MKAVVTNDLRLEEMQSSTHTLTTMHATLLAKLLSGELSVAETN